MHSYVCAMFSLPIHFDSWLNRNKMLTKDQEVKCSKQPYCNLDIKKKRTCTMGFDYSR